MTAPTYQKRITFKSGDGKTITRTLVAAPDPKRPGMYKVTEVAEDGHKWSYLYGKKNQPEIAKLITTMTRVNSQRKKTARQRAATTRRNPSFKTGAAAGAGSRGSKHRGVVKARSPGHRGVVKNPRAPAANPRKLHPGVRRAVELYSSFHGKDPKYVDEYIIQIAPVAMLVGKVAAIEYETPHNRTDRFRHEFSGRSRPMLAVSGDGRQLLLLGGQYYFNDHGIIDGVPE